MNQHTNPAQGRAPTPGAGVTHADDEMMTMKEVAAVMRVPIATLRYWRHLNTGPRSFRIGRSVRYWRTEVWAWIEEQTRTPKTRPTSKETRTQRTPGPAETTRPKASTGHRNGGATASQPAQQPGRTHDDEELTVALGRFGTWTGRAS